jgi:hypothetical protein
MSQTETDDRITDRPSNGKQTDPKPTRVLPTNRVAFAKQLDILRAFGAVGDTTRPGTNSEVAKLVSLHQATVGLTTAFFADVGLLKKTAEGSIPASEVISFNQAYKWSPESAAQRLAPILTRSWFAEALVPRLRFNPLTHEEAIQELALAASAGPSYKGQLWMLVDFLEAGGIIVKDNGHIRLAHTAPKADAEREAESKPGSRAVGDQHTGRHNPVATTFVNTAAGVVQFNISVKVDMTEFATWDPGRISAFFAGIAQVLAAKGNIEKQAAGS